MGAEHPAPGRDVSLEEIGATLRRVPASVAGPAFLIPMDDAGAIALSRPRKNSSPAADPHATSRAGSGFEPRGPGLFLADLTTAADCGPSTRFVHGASFTASHLVAGVVRRLRGGWPVGGPHAAGRQVGRTTAGDGRPLDVGQVTGSAAGAFAPVASFGVTVRANG
ncbi:hypothetical protein [Streptomyces sp. NPDC059262]|uniref:hypothetical protein n=1 Tax=Streptomyces sp. NPDC059262 TaxID=3346797 RepID=UPI0036BF8AC0